MAADDRELNDWAANIIKAENRYCQEVTVTKVHGACPYGHREGDAFTLTGLYSGGLCGSLLTAIMPSVVALHYGGAVLWEAREGFFTGRCSEGGRVEVAVTRTENASGKMVTGPCPFHDMTGRSYAGLDKHRVFVEVQHIEGNCLWGHRIGQRIEIDPFNVNGMCCLLYNQLYPYLHVLLSGATPAWATTEHSIAGECPDTFNRLGFRMSIEERILI
jgi:uncharacterized repeat protein (TIGR04076 family)